MGIGGHHREGTTLLIILGFQNFYRTLRKGVFYCRKCGGDRQYRHRAGRRFFTVFFIPIVPLNRASAHVQCLTCKTRYVLDVLSLPTAAQMQAALPAGMRAAVVIMLSAGDPASLAARRAAVAAAAGRGADGPLTELERRAAQLIAADLGMTQAQAIGVITMAEQGAQQG
jgi:hypothetical protein